MKNARLFFAVLLTMFIMTAHSQKKSEVVYLKIQQSYFDARIKSFIRISFPDENIKSIELSKGSWKNEGDNPEEIENTKLIQRSINSLTDAGYEVVSCTATGDATALFTLMVFSREKR
jgi:hypothetical protein